MDSSQNKALSVPNLTEALRLDKFLVQHFPKTSRAYWRDHLSSVQLNGRPAKKSALVHGGESLTFTKWPSDEKTPLMSNPKIKLNIIYEDDFLLAVDKPAGLPCFPLKAEENNTVVHGLLHLRPDLAQVDPDNWEAGLIHRLDNQTSGVLLVAKTKEAKQAFQELNQSGQINKTYQCWVEAVVTIGGEVSDPIAHHPKNKSKMIVVYDENKTQKPRARPAHTEFEVIQNQDTATLLKVNIIKGARHQIRVHLASAGYPIVGDKLYHPQAKIKAPRHLLHAWKVALTHPFTQDKIEITAAPPQDFLQNF